MLYEDCLCGPHQQFQTVISYHREPPVRRAYEGLAIARCRRCGLLRTIVPRGFTCFNPRVSRPNQYEAEKARFARIFQPLIEAIAVRKDSGRILDVGCASGVLMELLAEHGYEVFGIEPNPDALAVAQNKFGSHVFGGTLQDFWRRDHQRFDVIVYNHVLEHILDVNAELATAASALNPQGILVIGVPNTRNTVFILRGKRWSALQPLEHVWHFSDRYLARLVEKHGFRLLETRYAGPDQANLPFAKRICFGILAAVDQLLGTGAAIVLIAERT